MTRSLVLTEKAQEQERCEGTQSALLSLKVLFKMSSIGAEFFDADDDLLAGEEEPQALSWRGDPTTTHSDWTIIIEENNESQKKETKYPVHKAILGVGPRCSTYFATLFSSPNFKEQQYSTSRIPLNKSDASVFPIFLDYMYDGTPRDACSTDSVVALRSLARYFHCQHLMKTVNEFIQQDLSVSTAPSYLVQAWERSDTKLETSARQLILKHFESLDDHALQILPTPLFCSIWKEVQCDNYAFMSRVAYFFFRAHPEARNATLLSELTSPITLMDVRVVSGFLELVAQLDPQKEKDDSWLALDNLCKKCADALVTDWRLFDTELCVRKFLKPSVEGDFRGTGRIAIRLMGAGIEQAKVDYTRVLAKNHQLHVANDRLSARVKEQQERLAKMEESARVAKESSRRKDLEILGLTIGLSKHKKRAAELKDQVTKLEEQLAKATAKAAPKKRTGWA